jgi:hypothetical protein
MDDPETPRRLRFDLLSITILGFLSLVACFAASFVAWKRAQSIDREQCLSDLGGSVTISWSPYQETWSSEWPFHNVERINEFALRTDKHSLDDVRRLRRAFPGVPIYRDRDGWTREAEVYGPHDLIKLPEDQTADDRDLPPFSPITGPFHLGPKVK